MLLSMLRVLFLFSFYEQYIGFYINTISIFFIEKKSVIDFFYESLLIYNSFFGPKIIILVKLLYLEM